MLYKLKLRTQLKDLDELIVKHSYLYCITISRFRKTETTQFPPKDSIENFVADKAVLHLQRK